MSSKMLKTLWIAGILGVCVLCRQQLSGQGLPPDAPPPMPQGVEVMARGPVHEAFASPSTEPEPTQAIPMKPPLPIEEMPPAEKPAGDAIWIGGYHHWDDERKDFLWVSGCWRTKPPGREWVPGYWREQGVQWQWVAGFWTDPGPQQAAAKEIVYQPAPPPPPAIAPPGPPPNPESFYVPGHWVWSGDRYVWQAGYYARVQPGYVWVPSHYRWTPYGHIYIAGYWDLAIANRGMLYAPVYVNTVVVGPRYVYTPAYAVSDTIVLDAMFIRPSCCHYYYGDYYGPRYRELGFETTIVYSRTHYEPIIVYRTYEYRDNPRWLEVQIRIGDDRFHGRAAPPPRNIVQLNVYYKTNVIAPAAHVAAARGIRVVAVPPAARQQAATEARARHENAVAARRQAETPHPGARPLTAPRAASVPLRGPAPGAPGIHPNPQGAAAAPRPGPGVAPHAPQQAAKVNPAPGVAGHAPPGPAAHAGPAAPAPKGPSTARPAGPPARPAPGTAPRPGTQPQTPPRPPGTQPQTPPRPGTQPQTPPRPPGTQPQTPPRPPGTQPPSDDKTKTNP